jgi:iron complex outermembrane receptor protein
MGIRCIARAWLCLALCGATLSFAGEPTELPPVVSPLPPEEPRPESPARRDPSGSLTVVPRAEHRGETKDTAELAATVPGVQVQDLGGLLQPKALRLRGAASNGVLVLLDGIPLNGAGGVADLSTVPLSLVDRLEVLRGGGARYGGGALGGVVNVVTPSPSDGARASAEATYGSFGTVLGSLSASGALGDGQGLLLVHGGGTRGDFPYLYDDQPNVPGNALQSRLRENDDALVGGALLKYRRPWGAWTVDALGEVAAVRRGLAGTVQSPTPDAREEGGRLSASARLSRAFDSGAELGLRAFLKGQDSRFTGGYFGDVRQRLGVAGAQAEGSVALWGWHALSASAEVAFEGLSAATHPSWFRAGASAMDEVLLFDGALVLAPSLRLDRTGRFTGVSPKLGGTALLPWGLEVRGNVGQAFRAPSFLELYVVQGRLLPNPELRPERALSADLSLSRKAGALSATVGGFYALYEDLIAYEYYPPFLAKASNFAAAQAYGLEAEAKLEPHPLLSARASYTLLFSRNLRDDPRYYLNELPYRPRHTAWGRVAFGPSWLKGRVELNYQSEQFINRTQTASLPGRALLNAGVSTAFWAGVDFTASFELKNALDVPAQDVDGYPLPGRAAYLTLAVALERGPEKR